jgi:two-component system sensor histidine kinase QseC
MRSIRTRLLVMLLATTTLTWGAAAAWTWRDAHRQVDALLDAQLAQSARLLLAQAGHELGEGDGDDDDDEDPPRATQDEHPLERQLHFQAWDREGSLRYRSSSRTPVSRLSQVERGFSEVTVGSERWRVFSMWDRRQRVLLQVGQEHGVRDALVVSLVLRTLMPVLLGLLGTLVVMAWAVQRALRPLQRVAREVAQRSPDTLGPLALQPVPTEVEPLSRALDALLARLQRMMDSERQFTSDAAHELRTPLAAIKAHAQVARQSTQDQERAHALDQVTRGVDRATHVVEQLLTLARLDPQRPPQGWGAVDVHGVAREVLADLAPVAIQDGAELVLDGDAPGVIQGDATLVGTLVRNVVDNAVRYGPRGGTVTVRVRQGPDGVTLAVEDQGPGIPAAQRERVFDRFHRGANVTASGSGLGLSIVKRIAELHRATVTLEDGAGGQGLRLTVHFPRSAAPA